MTPKKIITVVGARPNFIKITQLARCIAAYPDLEHRLVHTGQHFDANMSDVFFSELNITPPDYNLGITTGTPLEQIAEIMLRLKTVFDEYKPDMVLVVGDVNSTFAAAFTAHKLGIPVGHIESGLRSFDISMPEENNRVLTDSISSLLFITEEAGQKNLIAEGRNSKNMHMVGNTMIDTLVAFKEKITASQILERLSLKAKSYLLMTMHRPATVDNEEGLKNLLATVELLTKQLPVVLPLHPRTKKNFERFQVADRLSAIKNLTLLEPLGYLDFQKLTQNSFCVITDSGGIQEETTCYKVPCITLRPNTERPSTVEIGTNVLLPFDLEKIEATIKQMQNGTYKQGDVPPLWDGRASERIVEIVYRYLNSKKS